MSRLLLCLPLCLVMASDRPTPATPGAPSTPARKVIADDGGQLPSADEMERLARTDPPAFLENCLRRYAREVKGYSLVMQKQESIDGRLNPREVVEVYFRDQPHSVFMRWIEGARMAERAVYVEGENDGKMLARPKGILRFAVGKVVSRDPDSVEAKSSGRYSIKEFGLKKAAERTLTSWKNAIDRKVLKVEYRGIEKVKETGNRPCYTFHGVFSEPQNEGCIDVVIHYDTETWLQTASVLRAANDRLIGAYYFRDIRLNPTFKADQFQKSALTQ